MPKTHRIEGGGGIGIHAVEEGNPQGLPILFIHGFSQCYLAWRKQLDSDLGRDYRLVAMDIRGHGQSDKPVEAYGDSRLWADDVQGVIQTLGLDGAVLCGWSYGGLIILDYLRHYGEDHISGTQFVGAASKLGSDDALSVIAPDFLNLVPGFFSTDVDESVNTLSQFVRLCVAREPAMEEFSLMLGGCVMAPPHVRQGLLSRSVDNDDLLPQVRKPVLLTHGVKDAVVLPKVVEQHKAAMQHAQVQMIPDAGHSPFYGEPEAFNHGLRGFIQSLN